MTRSRDINNTAVVVVVQEGARRRRGSINTGITLTTEMVCLVKYQAGNFRCSILPSAIQGMIYKIRSRFGILNYLKSSQ